MKRAPGGAMGFHGDTFTSGFGDFNTMKRKRSPGESLQDNAFADDFGNFGTMKRGPAKQQDGGAGGRSSDGPHSDMFSSGFGDFNTMKRGNDTLPPVRTVKVKRSNIAEILVPGYHVQGEKPPAHQDETNNKKRRNASTDISGDTLNSPFGDFNTMRRRRQA
ncbi:Coagulation factor V [Frankliniella fusca]|uniref:Coagulation factor V n=1 Tax=Frankliniella fusca TaxID=407009 RepID=A0AAE1HA38_9NEOP|nr:Coagulation factor V [Frankliniella fusca]